MLGYGVRVGKSMKNSTDTIFELEILAQKMRAKIHKYKFLQKCSKTQQNCAKMHKIVQKIV